MRRALFVLTAWLVAMPALAQPLNLPVSLEKIREGLSRPEGLKGLDAGQPTYHIDVTAQQKFDDLAVKVKPEKPAPQVGGGNDMYEQQRRFFPPIDNPRVQPYAAFSTSELITLGVEGLIESQFHPFQAK